VKSIIANIYKSRIKEEMYLYVAKVDLLTRVPEPLLKLFGAPVLVSTILLKEDKPLVRAKITDVLSNIEEKGFYLQMPPVQDMEMQALAQKNTKLGKL